MWVGSGALRHRLSSLIRSQPGGGRSFSSIFDTEVPWVVRMRLIEEEVVLGGWPPTDDVDVWEYEACSGRFVYWASFEDPESGFLRAPPGRRVVYAIEGTGAVGAYRRHSDTPIRLERFDRNRDVGAHLGQDGRWHWSAVPREVVWRGSDIGNDPVTAITAAWIARRLGHADAVDDELTVLPFGS